MCLRGAQAPLLFLLLSPSPFKGVGYYGGEVQKVPTGLGLLSADPFRAGEEQQRQLPLSLPTDCFRVGAISPGNPGHRERELVVILVVSAESPPELYYVIPEFSTAAKGSNIVYSTELGVTAHGAEVSGAAEHIIDNSLPLTDSAIDDVSS